MKRSKALLTLLCAAALVATSVFGTMAYLTDEDAVTNTFTVGQVEIKLNEAPVDENGKETAGDRVTENQYHLLPGHEYDKDPTVTILEDSESSYVRMLMTVHNASAVQAIIDADDAGENKVKDYADLFKGWKNDKWLYEGFRADEAANAITFEFRYHTAVAAPDDKNAETDGVELEPLFTQLVVPGYVTNEQIAALYGTQTDAEGDFVVNVVAHAIQAAGFADADAAWTAFDQQNPNA